MRSATTSTSPMLYHQWGSPERCMQAGCAWRCRSSITSAGYRLDLTARCGCGRGSSRQRRRRWP
jgi:hypothetical protein